MKNIFPFMKSGNSISSYLNSNLAFYKNKKDSKKFDIHNSLAIRHMIRSQLNLNYFLIYTIIVVNLFNFACSQAPTDADCIYQNTKNFDFYNPKSRLIDSPEQCTNLTSSCCYLEASYDFAGHQIENSFCVLLGGDINFRTQQIIGILTDHIRYHSKFIYENYGALTSIGNNLDYMYYSNYTCYERAQNIDYYHYVTDNCAFSNPDNTCSNVNDYSYSDKYKQLLYENITSNYCNNRDENNNCIYYQQNPNNNNSALSSLMEYLKVSLDVDDVLPDDDDKNDPFIKKFNTTTFASNFYSNCKPIVPAKVRIVCPSSYVSGYFNKFTKTYLLKLFVLMAIFLI